MKRNVFLILVAITYAGCQGSKNPSGASQPVPELPVITLKTTSANLQQAFSASVEGTSDVEIRPQVSGYISRIFADEGSYVRKGQPLFKIEDITYREQLNTAVASLHAAEANLINASINVEKQDTLARRKIVSQLQLRQAKASYSAQKAAVEQANAQVQNARVNLGFTLVKAPVNGYIGRIPFKTGSLVSTQQAGPLTSLSDIDDVLAYFSMSENDFVSFQKRFNGYLTGKSLSDIPRVSLQLSDGSIFPEKGVISAIEGQFDKNTGSITLRATFPNPERLLRSGNTGRVILRQDYDDILLLPVVANKEIQDKIYVFILDKDNKARQAIISVAGKSGNNYIVKDGVNAGDRIIAEGLDRLTNGAAVKPQIPGKVAAL